MQTMKKIGGFGFSLVLFLGLTLDLQADKRHWEMDKDHANVYFLIDHIFAKIGGRFQDFTIKAEIDPNDLEKGNFFCEIKAASISTEQPQRDHHLKTADFFAAEKYPVIRFTSSSIQKEQDLRYIVQGVLEIKGKQYDLSIPLTLSPPKKHPAMPDKEVLGLTGVITVDRLTLGIGDGSFYKMGMVGKDAQLLISFEMLADLGKGQ